MVPLVLPHSHMARLFGANMVSLFGVGKGKPKGSPSWADPIQKDFVVGLAVRRRIFVRMVASKTLALFDAWGCLWKTFGSNSCCWCLLLVSLYTLDQPKKGNQTKHKGLEMNSKAPLGVSSLEGTNFPIFRHTNTDPGCQEPVDSSPVGASVIVGSSMRTSATPTFFRSIGTLFGKIVGFPWYLRENHQDSTRALYISTKSTKKRCLCFNLIWNPQNLCFPCGFPSKQLRKVSHFTWNCVGIWVWLRIEEEGQTAGCGPCVHSPGFHVGTVFFEPQPCLVDFHERALPQTDQCWAGLGSWCQRSKGLSAQRVSQTSPSVPLFSVANITRLAHWQILASFCQGDSPNSVSTLRGSYGKSLGFVGSWSHFSTHVRSLAGMTIQGERRRNSASWISRGWFLVHSFSAIVLFKYGSPFPQGFGWFSRKIRIPGKNESSICLSPKEKINTCSGMILPFNANKGN